MRGLGIAIDNDGSCYVSGLFDSSITIGGKDLDFGTNVATDSAGFVYTSNLNISNRSVASLSRYTRSGDLLWTIIDTFARSQIRRLVVDKAGDAYILILMDSCVTLGNTVIIDTSGRCNYPGYLHY